MKYSLKELEFAIGHEVIWIDITDTKQSEYNVSTLVSIDPELMWILVKLTTNSPSFYIAHELVISVPFLDTLTDKKLFHLAFSK